MYLELTHLTKRFADKTVVRDVSLGLSKGRLLCILGASGCGKTTTLNMIGGFLKPDSGRILLDGEDITDLPPERRPVSTVFQSYSLFPHMTVLQNVMYGLKFRPISKSAAKDKGLSYLELVGLPEYADAHIHEISGGQQQRVALARALIVEPKVCLLDEPFSNLDAALRVKLRAELKRIQQELDMTMVFVTHDQEEALVIADQIAIMDQGNLIQLDTPERLLQAPSSAFVREFLGLDDLVHQSDGTLLKIIKKSSL